MLIEHSNFKTRPSSFFILCGNTAYNRGDRLNLSAQINLLQDSFPDCKITTSSFKPEQDAKWYNATIVPRGKYIINKAERTAIKQSNIVIWGGGALIADNSCRILIIFWAVQISIVRLWLRKPVMAWAHGVITNTLLGRLFANIPYSLCSAITVRDSNSLQAIKRISPALLKKTTLTADPAIFIKESIDQCPKEIKSLLKADKMNIAISATFWPFYYHTNDIIPYILLRKFKNQRYRNQYQINVYLKGLQAIAEHFIVQHNANIIFLPHYPHTSWPDTEYLQRIKSASSYEKHITIEEGDLLNPNQYATLWKQCDFGVTVSLHQTTVALAMDTPCFQLTYEPKGVDFYNVLGLQAHMADWGALFDSKKYPALHAAISYSFNNSAELLSNSKKHISTIKTNALQNIEVLKIIM